MAPENTPVPSIGGPGSPDVLELLLAWLPSRRWYPAKGSTQVPEPIGAIDLVDPEGAAPVDDGSQSDDDHRR